VSVVAFTPTQQQRLRELGAGADVLTQTFPGADERNAAFKACETEIVRDGRRRLEALRAGRRQPQLLELEQSVATALIGAGFVRVVTPALLGADALAKMGIAAGHALLDQVFWLDDGRCLRPMLAPNLYTLLRRLGRIWSRPFGIFEIGSCFRRDSKGSQHLNEFTMCNLVELGLPLDGRRHRLEELAAIVMAAASLTNYELVTETSEVYGDELDVIVDGIEVCSTAMGPHALDDAWGITEPWVGLGFGLERLLIAREGLAPIERVARSLTYVDGVRLNI
jgi:pyrrolysyl-tRNA synthetase-like protein